MTKGKHHGAWHLLLRHYLEEAEIGAVDLAVRMNVHIFVVEAYLYGNEVAPSGDRLERIITALELDDTNAQLFRRAAQLNRESHGHAFEDKDRLEHTPPPDEEPE